LALYLNAKGSALEGSCNRARLADIGSNEVGETPQNLNPV